MVDQPSNTVQKGLVISSNPAEGNNVAANTFVTLYVSTGAAPVAVPNVEGKQENAAQTDAADRRLPGLGEDGRHVDRTLGHGGEPESGGRH